MKVAHFAQFGPHRAGQYATVKDLILVERALGIDAQFIDSALPCKECGFYEIKIGKVDGEITTQSLEWVYDADLIVRHTTVPTSIEALGIPMILCLHGRPESTFILERLGRLGVFSFLEKASLDLRYKSYITFWKEFLPQWQLLMPDASLEYVPAPINLSEFQPEGPKFNFGNKGGSPNLVVADLWREDDTPFNIIMATALFQQKYCSTAKLHLFGLPESQEGPVAVLARAMDRVGLWGQAFTLYDKMPEVYRSADILLTPHVIATRVIREACASGIPIIAGVGCPYTPYTANPKDIEGYAKEIDKVWTKIQNSSILTTLNSRQIAKENFDLMESGKAMLKIFERILNKYTKRKANEPQKIFIDIGGHLGESVLQFYQDVDDALKYQIYSFEPNPEAFKIMQKNLGRLKNVQMIQKAVGIDNDIVSFYPGLVRYGEGSTILPGKKTGAVDYANPIKVEMIDFIAWWIENIHLNVNDKVIVKINIEGGEYPLISRLLDTKLLANIHALYLSLHSDKFENPQVFKTIEDRLKNELPNFTNCTVTIQDKGLFSFRNLNEVTK
jgi:FkbM family methyltransferase